jgi:hypothetical protein
MDSRFRKILHLEYLAAVVLVAFYLIGGLYPLLGQVFEMQKIIWTAKHSAKSLSKEDQALRLRQFETALEDLQQRFDKLQQSVKVVEGKIIKDESVPQVTLKLEDLAAGQNIKLTSIRPITAAMPFPAVGIELSFQSTFEDLVKFLTRIQDAELYMAVDQLRLLRNDQLYPQMGVQITLFIPSQNVPAPVGKEGS